MIRVWYEREGRVHRLTAAGHAGFAPRGHDIVCAGVSALLLGLLAWLEEEQEGVESLLYREEDDGGLFVEAAGGKRLATAFGVVLSGLREVARQYPGFVEVGE